MLIANSFGGEMKNIPSDVVHAVIQDVIYAIVAFEFFAKVGLVYRDQNIRRKCQECEFAYLGEISFH